MSHKGSIIKQLNLMKYGTRLFGVKINDFIGYKCFLKNHYTSYIPIPNSLYAKNTLTNNQNDYYKISMTPIQYWRQIQLLNMYSASL